MVDGNDALMSSSSFLRSADAVEAKAFFVSGGVAAIVGGGVTSAALLLLLSEELPAGCAP